MEDNFIKLAEKTSRTMRAIRKYHSNCENKEKMIDRILIIFAVCSFCFGISMFVRHIINM